MNRHVAIVRATELEVRDFVPRLEVVAALGLREKVWRVYPFLATDLLLNEGRSVALWATS